MISPASSTAERMTPTVSMAELDTDGHSIFRHYRPHTPLLRRSDGALIVIRADDAQRLMTDPRTRQGETEHLRAKGITSGPIFDMLGLSMVLSNGAAHRRRRAPMSRTFAFRMIADLRPRIRAVADDLITTRLADGAMNLVDDYSALIPARAIAAILGMPEEDIPSFTRAVYSFSRAFTASLTAEQLPSVTEGAQQLQDYAERLLAERREKPRDDFLTAFAREVDAQEELSPMEVLSQLVTVIIGGSDTTRAAGAIQVALLLQHAEQWDAVCQDAALVPGAVLEALRYEPSVGSLPRFTLADIEMDDEVVPAGSGLGISIMSAMRDPALYADPERFDIRRADHPRWHLVFGGGAHRCLGEALAKVELEEGLAALAARLPQLRIEGAPLTVTGHSGIRRVNDVTVTWPRQGK